MLRRIDHNIFASDAVTVLFNEPVRRLADVFVAAGFELRPVGGCVRDALLGRPAKDIDLTTNATPDEIVSVLASRDIQCIETGLQHGTLTAVIDRVPYEITTLRVDVETDGRHAVVEWTRSFEADAARRDLTMNAMSATADGRIYDYHGGIADLRRGRVRFVGNPVDRIQEDFLRILRYFRFHGRLDRSSFERATDAAIAEHGRGLERISAERIWMELAKIFPSSRAAALIRKMDLLGVMDAIGVEVGRRKLLRPNHSYNAITGMVVLMRHESDVDRYAEQLKWSREERRLAEFLFERRDHRATSHEVEILLTRGEPREHVVEWVRLTRPQDAAYAEVVANWTPPAFPVSGRDLIGRGMRPGPQMGEELRRLRDLWERSGFLYDRDMLLARVTSEAAGSSRIPC